MVDLFDEIELAISNSFSVSVSGAIIDEKNILETAYERLCEFLGRKLEVSVKVLKNIPIGAGLGGGSSDTAAFLAGMNRLFDLKLSVEQLVKIAATVGSDVPFFFSGGSAIVRGRGEIIEPLELPKNYHIVLVVPNFSVNTRWAYSQLRNSLTSREIIDFLVKSLPKNFNGILKDFKNDFEEIILSNYPHLGDDISRMRRFGAELVSISGSGSSFFGIFKNFDIAKKAFDYNWNGKKYLLKPIKYDLL